MLYSDPLVEFSTDWSALSTMNVRKTQEREERKKAILNAAIKVFSSKGFIRTTVSDIAREAGFSKSALYFYFKKKEDIIREILLSIIDDLRKLIGEINQEKVPVFGKIKKMFRAILDYVENNREMITILYSEAHCLYTSKEKTFREFMDKYKDFVSEGISSILYQGIKKGEIKDCNIELLSTLLRGVLMSFILYRVSGGRRSNDECIQFVIDTLKDGLLCKQR